MVAQPVNELLRMLQTHADGDPFGLHAYAGCAQCAVGVAS